MIAELALPILTERLVLRRYRPDDAEAVWAYRSDPEVVRYVPHGPWTREEAVTKVADWAQNRGSLSRDNGLALAVEFEGQLVGDLVLMAADETLQRLEIGWCFNPAFHGRGFALEGATAMLDVAFDVYGAQRVFAQLDPRNAASAKLCSRLGMVREADLRNDWKEDDGWSGNSIYGLLDSDPRPGGDRVSAPSEPRPPLDFMATERTALDQWLDFYRDSLLRKVSGLSAAELVQVSAPPSTLSLAGLVRHLTFVEQYWFANVVSGRDETLHYADPDNWDADFDDVSPENALAEIALYRSELPRIRALASAVTDLDVALPVQRHGRPVNLRWVLIHMIEEYARHLGHADLLRERIDGVTGY